MVERSYKYRFYPTDEQKILLAKTFGCVRYVYNWALAARTQAYRERQESLGYGSLSAALSGLKREPDRLWLAEVSSVPLQQALRHLDRAFVNFFEKRAGYPKFKKKHRRQSATYTRAAFSWDGETLKLAKMPKALDIRWSRRFVGNPSSVIVSKDSIDRYFVSFRVREDIQPKPVIPNIVGIDLGLTHAAILSNGEKIANPRHFQRDEKRLARAQHRLARKERGSQNREKARKKVARIHAHIADARSDFLHKLTTRLINENQVICAESLQVKNMVQNPHLAKSISDVGWGEMMRQLEYKAKWYGRTFVRINTFFPSSKRCSQCGHALGFLPLEIRSWTCPECHATHDRDINAASNILAEGLSVLACGETVRPAKAPAAAGSILRSRNPIGASL